MSESNALAIVKAAKDKGALVFANIENMEAKVDLYKTEVTEITFKASEFHNIQSKMMPTKAATDRIGEACGVLFIQSACRVIAEIRDDPICGKHTVYCAEAQGKVRMTDGSWRTSPVEPYEFDPVIRAMLDKNVTELNNQTKGTVGKAIMEYTKVARQRAATGARLRVIRQLTGMPSAFTKEEAEKPFIFTRVVQNTEYILQTPEGRAMATAQALGWDAASLFGARKPLPPAADNSEEPYTPAETETPEPENKNSAANMAAKAAADEEPDFPMDTEGETQHQKQTEFMRLTTVLEEYMSYKEYLDVTTKSGTNPYNMAQNELSSTTATEESRSKMITRIRDFLITKKVPGVA